MKFYKSYIDTKNNKESKKNLSNLGQVVAVEQGKFLKPSDFSDNGNVAPTQC